MNLQGKKVAVLVEQKYEDLELWYPAVRLQEAGAEVVLVGPKAGETYPSKHGYPAKTDKSVLDVTAADFDGVVVPGGFSPDHMRREPKFRELVRESVEAGKPVAAICHGPWMLCSAKVLQGRRATSFFSIREDMENAGAEWVDEAVVVDGPVITSRTPADLVPFTVAFMKALAG
ncbi:MAG: DJ-1/PfpI/YhbO family deglycase/protease [Acidobacteria bacterium]|nr:DJ-1/PfpI/YhbO family deglycase/protease [Acidobacteriota bacterium]